MAAKTADVIAIAESEVKKKAENEITGEEFNARMAEGLRQAAEGETSSIEDVRNRIMGELDGLVSDHYCQTE